MAKEKAKAKRGRGRPALVEGLDFRVLVRLDKRAREALAKYSKTTTGIGSDSTAARVLIIDGLKKAGLL